MANSKYPVRTCARCRRGYAYVRGYTEAGDVCGVCLAREAQKKAGEKKS